MACEFHMWEKIPWLRGSLRDLKDANIQIRSYRLFVFFFSLIFYSLFLFIVYGSYGYYQQVPYVILILLCQMDESINQLAIEVH